ncbi:hypothetical protein AAES_50371 [Amazona aestiva]|uniref:Uncharacterized protein n=1 Tax=Amazona aestiva TaxID=12930 RepID=A0A0Q3MNW8_AMAAE|nr:hypothetical protein AAES_50371 [Amazona aestiva]
MLPGLFWLLFFAGDEGSALKMEMIWVLFLSLVPVYSRGQGVYVYGFSPSLHVQRKILGPSEGWKDEK